MVLSMVRSEQRRSLALGVDPTARNAVKAKLTGVPFMYSCYYRQALQQANAVELANKFVSHYLMLTQRYVLV